MKSVTVIWIVALLVAVGAFAFMDYATAPQHAFAQSSDKYDGDCQPDDSAGRCADKCPAPTPEGVYYDQGIGRDGQVVCGFSYYHACPYADAVSADDPLCDKISQEHQATQNDINQMEAQIEANPAAFAGK